MAKTLDEAGVKRLIQEIKGANKNLNTPIPISTENTPESMAQNVKNIADYVEKAKAAGIADVNGMGVTCIIDGENSGVGYLYVTNTRVLICGILAYENNSVSYISVIDGTYGESSIVVEGHMDQVTSDMLATGARKPIILTPDTTEVDEATYQKLLSDDVDVVFKTSMDDANLCILTYKYDDGDVWRFTFTCFSYEGASLSGIYLYGYEVSITKTGDPHPCEVIDNSGENQQFDLKLLNAGFINKSALSPVLQEIDLTGTDAERKAKLDKFETDWKALTGASHLAGARFVGLIDNDGGAQCLLSYNEHSGYYSGISAETADSETLIKIQVSPNTGSIITTPLFSHLEAITIYTGNTPEHKQANLDNIKAYVDNLTALGVDVAKGYMIPCKFPNSCAGVLSAVSNSLIVAITTNGRGELNCYEVYIGGDNPGAVYSIGGFQLKISSNLTTTSKQIVGAINEVNTLAKGYSTIFTPIELTTETAQNKTAIDARVAAFTAQGISLTNGCCIPVTYKGVYAGNISLINGDWYGLLIKNTNNPADNINIKLSADGTITEGNSAQ